MGSSLCIMFLSSQKAGVTHSDYLEWHSRPSPAQCDSHLKVSLEAFVFAKSGLHAQLYAGCLLDSAKL